MTSIMFGLIIEAGKEEQKRKSKLGGLSPCWKKLHLIPEALGVGKQSEIHINNLLTELNQLKLTVSLLLLIDKSF